MKSVLKLSVTLCLISLPWIGQVQAEQDWEHAVDSGATVRVVASIHPLAMMVSEIAGADVSVNTLLPPGATPHDFAFRVSDRQHLENADFIVWVGADLEPYLHNVLRGKEQLSMRAVSSGEFTHTQEAESETDKHEETHDHSHDAHLWLSPDTGAEMMMAIAERLAELRPDREQEYRRKAMQAATRLRALPQKFPVVENPHPYVTSHPVFSHLLHDMGFPEPMTLSSSPEVPPSAKALWRVSKALSPGDCLLAEWPEARLWQQHLAEKYSYRLQVVDIMGFSEGVKTYYDLLSELLQQVNSCLSGTEKQKG